MRNLFGKQQLGASLPASASTYTRVGCIALFAAIALLALYSRLAASDGTIDDAFITYRYARNIVEGRGFVYNAGEQVLGSTTPLFTLLIASSYGFGVPVDLAAKAFSAVSELLTLVLLLYVVSRLSGSVAGGLLASLLYALSPMAFWSMTGMETSLHAFLLLGSLTCLASRKLYLSAVFSALAVLNRPDAILLILVLAAFYSRVSSTHTLRYLLVVALCVAPWLVFSTIYFHSPIPNSVWAKQASYTRPIHENAQLVYNEFAGGTSGTLVVGGWIAGLIAFAAMRRSAGMAWAFPLFFLLHITVFVLSGARIRSGWYTPHLWPIYLSLVAVGFTSFVNWLSRSIYWRQLALGALLTIALILSLMKVHGKVEESVVRKSELISLARDVQNVLLPAVRTHGPGVIAMESIGTAGWYTDLPILDLGGLVSPAVIDINKRKGRHDFVGVIKTFVPKYYIAWEDWDLKVWTREGETDWLTSHYERVTTLGYPQSRWVLFISRGSLSER